MSKCLSEVITAYRGLLYRLDAGATEDMFLEKIVDLNSKLGQANYAQAYLTLVSFAKVTSLSINQIFMHAHNHFSVDRVG